MESIASLILRSFSGGFTLSLKHHLSAAIHFIRILFCSIVKKENDEDYYTCFSGAMHYLFWLGSGTEAAC
jgi:hypothetical protein